MIPVPQLGIFASFRLAVILELVMGMRSDCGGHGAVADAFHTITKCPMNFLPVSTIVNSEFNSAGVMVVSTGGHGFFRPADMIFSNCGCFRTLVGFFSDASGFFRIVRTGIQLDPDRVKKCQGAMDFVFKKDDMNSCSHFMNLHDHARADGGYMTHVRSHCSRFPPLD